MSSCPDRESLLLLVDDELDPPERVVVARHVEACNACREFVEGMRSLNRTGRSALRGMVVRASRRKADARRVRFSRPLALAVAAAVVVVMSAAVWVSMKNREGGVDDSQQALRPAQQPRAQTTSNPRPVPPLMDEQFERWAAAHRQKRIALVALEEVAVFKPRPIYPIDGDMP
jgi:anti-sigma factor RsiW